MRGAVEKANCCANAFETKKIIDAEIDEHLEITNVHPAFFCGMPTKTWMKISALSPGTVTTKIVKRCANAVAQVLHKIIICIITFREKTNLR